MKLLHIILLMPLSLNLDFIFLEFKDYRYKILLCNTKSPNCFIGNKTVLLWENKRD